MLELMTSIWSGLDGLTHAPPMKKWSGALRDTLAISVRLTVALLVDDLGLPKKTWYLGLPKKA